MSNILIIKHGSLGDLIQAQGAIQDIKETYQNSKILTAAVVAKPNEKWGETPCAFVELKDDEQATEKEIIEFCKKHLASFKCPKHVIFKVIPKTSTGKIQKFALREIAKEI